MKLLIILIASISCYVSAAVKHGVTATRWFKDNTFYVEFHNNTFGYGLNVQRQDHDLVCEVIYNLDITDLNTYTTYYNSYPIVLKGIFLGPGESTTIQKEVELFDADLRKIHNIRIDNSSESTPINCTSLSTKTDAAVIKSIEFLVSIGKLDKAYSYLRFIKDKNRFKVLDLSGKFLEISLEDLSQVKKNLGVKFIDINYTNLQDDQFKVEENRACKLRENSICGVVYNQGKGKECGKVAGKVGENKSCGVMSYNYKADAKICGAIFKKKADERVCGCKLNALSLNVFGVSLKVGCQKANTCRSAEFGVEKARYCRHESFGAESYYSCRNVQNGYDTDFECTREEFGIAELKSCYLKVENNVLKNCSYSETSNNLLDLNF